MEQKQENSKQKSELQFEERPTSLKVKQIWLLDIEKKKGFRNPRERIHVDAVESSSLFNQYVKITYLDSLTAELVKPWGDCSEVSAVQTGILVFNTFL